jgi:succinylglutamate desuccinylase
MTSSAEHRMEHGTARSTVSNAQLSDFLAYTLAGTRPSASEAHGVCANGVRWTWLDEGMLQLEPAEASGARSVLASAGVHGDETAPIELLSLVVRDIAEGRAALSVPSAGDTRQRRGDARRLPLS